MGNDALIANRFYYCAQRPHRLLCKEMWAIDAFILNLQYLDVMAEHFATFLSYLFTKVGCS